VTGSNQPAGTRTKPSEGSASSAAGPSTIYVRSNNLDDKTDKGALDHHFEGVRNRDERRPGDID
jgi:hypothetical protein